jgi:hypothetical protein
MKKRASTLACTLVLGGVAFAQASQMMFSVPTHSVTVTDWYKQSVYDPSKNKIGEIMDVLLSSDGKDEPAASSLGKETQYRRIHREEPAGFLHRARTRGKLGPDLRDGTFTLLQGSDASAGI